MPTAEEVRTTAIARGRAIKRTNALATFLCGGVPAAILGVLFPSPPERWLIGFVAGLIWANAFEYVYHRCLLHLPGSFFGRRHLLHHRSVGTAVEAEEVNLGGGPQWVGLLFVINGVPIVAFDLLFKLGVAPAMLAAFAVYL